jgi:Co/Zn/Cd efflux system component
LLEIVAPSISVLALIVVTVLVTQQAIRTIQSIESPSSIRQNRHTREEPNLYIILFFSIFNLLLDGINMYFFTRPNHLSICSKISFFVSSCCRRYQRTPGNDTEDGMTDQDMTDLDRNDDDDDRDSHNGIVLQPHPQPTTKSHTPVMSGGNNLLELFPHTHTKEHYTHHSQSSATARTTKTVPTNMNMCSAYTHVLADTLRSIAVITAVLLALYNDIEPALADATAALIVSFLIALSLIPLIQGLYNNVYELYHIRSQLQQHSEQDSHCQNTTTINSSYAESNHYKATIV